MKKILSTILLLFSILQLFGQTGYKQKIRELISITFPQKPEILDTLGQSSYQFMDSSAVYSVIAQKIDQEKMAVETDQISEIYDNLIKGMLNASQGKLISKKQFEIDGLKGSDIESVSKANPNLPDLRFRRILLVNNTIFTINFWTLSENRQTTETARTKFFNSLTIIADKTTLSQGTEKSGLFTFGYITGIFFSWVFIAGVIAGIILLIRRLTRKKKNPSASLTLSSKHQP
ncbi:MAG: hypothetical protein JWM28_1466 [Chitinophagaceae bacterium]|nr:hypothetical protein [Chitinophagaceae bacterium]